jgi:hypothetical protein
MVGTRGGRFGGDERAQTLQDYALGVSLFLAVVFVVVGFIVPSVLAPFESGVSGDRVNQADRVSERIVENASVGRSPNELNVTQMTTIAGLDMAQLRARYSIPSTSYLNVSVRTLEGDEVVTSVDGTRLGTDRELTDSTVVTSTRIVTLSDGSCEPACRLVVGVW